MKKILLFLICLTISFNIYAEIFPLSLPQRVNEGKIIVYGQVQDVHSYWNADRTNIYTFHKIKIIGQWRGLTNQKEILIVDLGGQVGDHIQETVPSVSLQTGQEGVFILEPAAEYEKCPGLSNSNLIQTHATASVQGVILHHRNTWLDVAQPTKSITSQELFESMKKLSGQSCLSPEGKNVGPPTYDKQVGTSNKTAAVTSLANGNNISTTTFFAGTALDAALEMVINGSGFGTTPGTIDFEDADAGGGTNKFSFPAVSSANYSRYGAPSDIISWTNTQVRIKIPRSAGTGVMEIFNSSNVSQGTANITIDWSLVSTVTTFSGFALPTRQNIKLANVDGNGGITFRMSSTGSANFFADVAAKNAFKNTLDLWRCATFVNFNLDLNAATTNGFASDGVSVVVYDNTLASGVLGRATTRTLSTATGACNLHNTYWRVSEIDIQFPTIPFSGFTWNFNTSGVTSSQFSFQTVSLHELGHGHGMGHVIDQSKVMHYAQINGVSNVVLNSSDVAAGVYKMGFSTAPNCITTPTPMTALNSATACTPLPVSILFFEANQLGVDNKIMWQTNLEDGVQFFELEYSWDGINFTRIDRQVAQSKELNNYEFLHLAPKASNNYYRLAVVDLEGQKTYTHTILLQRKDVQGFYVYPNPVQDILNVKVLNQGAGAFQFQLLDISGRTVKQGRLNLENDHAFVDLTSISIGVYFLQIETKAGKEIFKFSKE